MDKRFVKILPVIFYWAVIIALLCLFFTNDFGLVDIHKTSIIDAVGIDSENDEVQVTARLAVPQPSQSGDNVQYTEVQGSGQTFAEALNEINAKTGFYPKLQFCKLILIGDGCRDADLFRILGCLYRKNYSELTALVAMCEGKASDMLAAPATVDSESVSAIQQVLSEELKKSANVSSVTLRDIAVGNYSESRACYMPYVQINKPGTSESGDDKVGGDSVEGGSQEGGESSGGSSSGGGSGEEGGSSGQSGSSAQSGGAEFTARKTAIFSDGRFAGVLDEAQSFALDVIENKIRMASLPCEADGVRYTVGLKNADGGVKLKIKDGVPYFTVSFKATAQIQGSKTVLDPKSVVHDDVVKQVVLKGAEEEIRSRMQELVAVCVQNDCDVLGARRELYRHSPAYYSALGENLLSEMQVEYDIKIKSLN